MAGRSCLLWTSNNDPCTCANADGVTIGYNPTADSYLTSGYNVGSPYHQCCIANGVGAGCAYTFSQEPMMGLQPAMGSGTIVRPTKPTLTGQPVKWRRQSGSTDEGTILGLSTTQLLIVGAVGVGAYLLMKKKKK